MRPTNRRLAGRAGILILVALLAAGGCASPHNHPDSQGKRVVLERGHTGKRVVLERGHTKQNQSWQLVASEQGHHLGLYLEEPSGTAYSGSIGFSAAPSAGFWMEGYGPGDSIFYYGPAPTSAVKVRLSAPGYAPILIPTKPIPTQDGLPHGRFFIVAPPSPAGVSWTVTLLNATDHRVAFADF